MNARAPSLPVRRVASIRTVLGGRLCVSGARLSTRGLSRLPDPHSRFAARARTVAVSMALNTGFEPPDVVLATLTGVVTSADQARLVDWVRDSVRRAGAVRLLVRLERFAGWNPAAAVDDARLWLRDDEGVTTIAIVGRPEWKLEVLTLIAQPLRHIPIGYFETEAAARAWLGQNAEPATSAITT